MKIILTVLALFLVNCGKKVDSQTVGVFECSVATTTDDARQDVLVIGDSVSIGYTPWIAKELGNVDVIHNDCNGRTSANGVAHLEQWLAHRAHWDVVTFNHGIWDTKADLLVTDETYRANLTNIVERLLANPTVDQIIFITTTDIEGYFINQFIPDREDRFNEIAKEVMAAQAVTVFDLNAISKGMNTRDGVHYDTAGYSILGAAVAEQIQLKMGAL